MVIAPFIAFVPDGLFSYIQQSLGSLSIPILAVVLTGMMTKKVPALGAKVVMIGGVLLYLSSLLILEPHFRETAVLVAQAQGISDVAELSLIKAQAYPHFLYVMGILFLLNIGVMLLFGKLKPKKVIVEEDRTDVIDVTPWKYALAFGLLITLAVISTYFVFV